MFCLGNDDQSHLPGSVASIPLKMILHTADAASPLTQSQSAIYGIQGMDTTSLSTFEGICEEPSE